MFKMGWQGRGVWGENWECVSIRVIWVFGDGTRYTPYAVQLGL